MSMYIFMYVCMCVFTYVCIYMYVCMYVCWYICIMYVCVYVYVYVCMYLRIYICMYVCWYVCIMYVCMYICVYVFTYVYMYVCMYVFGMYVYVCVYLCMYVYVYVCMYVCVCMYLRMYVYMCMYACMFVGMYVCMCIYVFMYVCMYVSFITPRSGGEILYAQFKVVPGQNRTPEIWRHSTQLPHNICWQAYLEWSKWYLCKGKYLGNSRLIYAWSTVLAWDLFNSHARRSPKYIKIKEDAMEGTFVGVQCGPQWGQPELLRWHVWMSATLTIVTSTGCSTRKINYFHFLVKSS
jgi:hypothetical protein